MQYCIYPHVVSNTEKTNEKGFFTDFMLNSFVL